MIISASYFSYRRLPYCWPAVGRRAFRLAFALKNINSKIWTWKEYLNLAIVHTFLWLENVFSFIRTTFVKDISKIIIKVCRRSRRPFSSFEYRRKLLAEINCLARCKSMTYNMKILLVVIICQTIYSFLFPFSYDNIVVDECLLLVQKLNERIQFFAKKCKKNEPAHCLTLQELTADHHSLELFWTDVI